MLNTTFPYNQRMVGNDNDTQQTSTLQVIPFEKIKTPTLIVHGTHDADVPFYNGVYAYEHIPGAQRYWMKQEDHLGFWLSPDAGKAQNMVLDFLLRHAPVAARYPDKVWRLVSADGASRYVAAFSEPD
jgi:pimeloyl-ACP methyl ester carboxylesterase